MADGDNLRLGRRNTSSAETRITRSGAADLSAFTAWNNGVGTGVFGRSASPTASGVFGENTGGGSGTAGRTCGLGPAVLGDNTGDGVGVRGQGRIGVSAQGRDTGIHAIGASYGIEVQSGSGATTAPRTCVGIYARGNGQATWLFDGMGVLGEGTSCGVYGVGGIGVYGAIPETESPQESPLLAGRFEGPVLVSGSLTVRGTKSAAVPHPDGSLRTLYALESPESFFEDFGRAQLSQGHARVEFDRDFAVLVRTDEYHVFLTPEGDSNGLYVSGRSADGFDVREQQRGTSDLVFSYRVVAKRKDIEAERLQKAEAPPPPPPTPPEQPGNAEPPQLE